MCANRRLHESGGSTLEAAAGNDAGEEEAETGLTAHFLICHVEHLAHPTWDSKAPPSHKTKLPEMQRRKTNYNIQVKLLGDLLQF